MLEVDAKPFPYRFDPARGALVVIDMQRDSLAKDLLAPVADIIPTVADLIRTFRAKGWPILHTRESRAPDHSACDCLLIEDATASDFPAFKAATLDMIRARGAIVGWTAPLAEFKQAIA